MRIYLSSIAPQVINDLNFIRPDLRLNVLQPFVFRNNQGIDADIWRSLKQITNSLFLDSGTFELSRQCGLYDVEECFNKYALSLDSLSSIFDFSFFRSNSMVFSPTPGISSNSDFMVLLVLRVL